jgi:hypothetical protein
MPVGHVHHRAGLSHRAFARVELHFDKLHVLAVDAEVDLVSRPRLAGIGGGGGAAPPLRYAASDGTAAIGVQLVIPAVNTSVLPSAVPFSMLEMTSCSLTGPS